MLSNLTTKKNKKIKEIMPLEMLQAKTWIINNITGDYYIWVLTILLFFFGNLVIYSSIATLAYKSFGGNTEYFLIKQWALSLLTLLIIWGAHKIDFTKYLKYSRILIFVAIFLLAYTQLFGSNINDATRWISLPFGNLRFQPSEFAFFALIVWLACRLANSQGKINSIRKTIIPILGVISIVVLLVAINNISSAVLIFLVCLIMMIIGRVSIKYLSIIAIAGVMIGSIAMLYGERGHTAVSRITSFFDATPQYQETHAYIAIAGGGIRGRGPGQSQQKHLLPNPHSDFIFPLIIEEYGLLGGVTVIIFFLILFNRCVVIARKTSNLFGKLLCLGLGLSIVVQAFINITVAVGLGPITGIPLPFLSMGGSSLLLSGLSVGVILSVSTNIKTKKILK